MKQIKLIIIGMIITAIFSNAKDKTLDERKDDNQTKVEMQDIRNGIVFSQSLAIVKDTNEELSANGISNENVINYVFSNGNKFNSKSEIMIKFTSKSDIDIEKLESTYNLKLKRKMNSGDYLFENLSGNTLDIINLILNDESSNIERIMPNMILNMQPM